MKSTSTILIALAAAVALSGPAFAANDAQSGTASPCLNYNVMYNAATVPEGPDVVEVEAGTTYELSVDGAFTAFVDWWDADGFWLDYGEAGSGEVPAGAAFGTICASDFDMWPTTPSLTATWYYQDGF